MKKLFLYSLIALSLVSVFNISYAQDYTLLEPLPSVEEPDKTITKITINEYITYVFKFAIALAVLLATIMIIIGGFEYMLSESPFSKGSGKTRIQNAAWGLLAAFASYLILQTIDPRLVQINTSIPPICPDGLTTDPKTKESACNKALTEDFTSRLTDNLKSLNETDKAKIFELRKDVRDFKESIEALEEKERERPLSPEDKNNLEGLKADVRRKEAEDIKISARFIGASSFSQAITHVHNPANYVTPIFGGASTLKKDGADSIDNYISQINSMEEDAKKLAVLQDHEGAAMIRMRKQTYIEEIAKEKEVRNNISAYMYAGGSEKTSAERRLKEILRESSELETRKAGSRTDNELMQEYQLFKKVRADRITQVLNPPKK